MNEAVKSLPEGWEPMLEQVERTIEEAMAVTVMREETLSSWASATAGNRPVAAEALCVSKALVWPPQLEAIERCFQEVDRELQGGEDALQEYLGRLSQLRQDWERWQENGMRQ